MKFLIFAAALTMAGTGAAQTTPVEDAPAKSSSAAPERDARGIAVVSDAATPPAGANQTFTPQPGAQIVAAPNQAAAFATQPSSKTYGPCTKNQTDGCIQTYERGRAPK